MNTGGTEEGGGREREDFKLVKTRPAKFPNAQKIIDKLTI